MFQEHTTMTVNLWDTDTDFYEFQVKRIALKPYMETGEHIVVLTLLDDSTRQFYSSEIRQIEVYSV